MVCEEKSFLRVDKIDKISTSPVLYCPRAFQPFWFQSLYKLGEEMVSNIPIFRRYRASTEALVLSSKAIAKIKVLLLIVLFKAALNKMFLRKLNVRFS